jgi:sugar phosphate permease
MTHAVTADPGYTTIFRQRSFWGTCSGQFCCNYLLYFMLTWLPTYLVLERRLSTATMVKVASLYYLVDAASAISTGWLQDFWIRKGYTPTLVRKSAMAIGFLIAAIAISGLAVAGANTYVPWLMAAGVGCGMTAPGIFAFAQTLAGPRATGKWYGAQNGFSNFAGVVGPALTGFVLERTGNFAVPFGITAALCIAGGLAWVLMVGRVEQVNWGPEGEASVATAGAQA